ncbi:tripartite tricarboxylate transporter substrate binding protein [Brevibacterium sp.]|uniref:tripartite tricarboxylate transporter substrate binding protein n=1 Tax=Brevibacterium sp. TaxID=1701 RepID=UPI0028113562|nr:tripartite tricarboxylate transporter substrate binding protein [Brevibacterium sp.]
MKHQKALLASVAGVSALGLALSGCSGGGSESSGSEEGFTPDKVTMIVPFAAGGGSDIAGRATASGLEQVTDTTITVQNIDGGSGAVGYSEFLGRNGDPNYLLATETAMLALPATQDVEFTHKSFTPIMKLGDDYTLIVAKSDSPLNTCEDLTEKGKKERTVVAISGATGLDNITFTLMEKATQSKFDRVPFESGAEVISAVMGGQVEAISVNPGEVSGQLESGDLKPLCAAAEERYSYPALKDIPTAKEQGIDVAFAQFRGVIAPGDIPEDAKQYWIDKAKEFAETDAYSQYIEDNMMQPNTAYGDEFATYLDQNDKDLREAVGK